MILALFPCGTCLALHKRRIEHVRSQRHDVEHRWRAAVQHRAMAASLGAVFAPGPNEQGSYEMTDGDIEVPSCEALDYEAVGSLGI